MREIKNIFKAEIVSEVEEEFTVVETKDILVCKAGEVFEHSKNLLRSKSTGDWVVGLVYYHNILKVNIMSEGVVEFKVVEESGNS